MELSTYFEPINIDDVRFLANDFFVRFGDNVMIHSKKEFPSLKEIDIAIIGVGEDRNAINNKGCKSAPNSIREKLYDLFPPSSQMKVADLGNLIIGNSVEDTYFILTEILADLLKKQIVPIILGGSQDLTFANYKAYEKIGQIINLFSVDSKFDIGHSNLLDSQSYLNKIVISNPNYLFNYTNVGYQTYFVDPASIKLMDQLRFDVYRLGVIQQKMHEIEPLVRNADMLSIDISAVRQSDAPGNGNASPHGFYGEELCQITRFAGLSDKLTSIGFYEVNPDFDRNGQTAHLTAHAIWYFIEGFYNRKHDFPYKDKKSYKKYIVSLKGDTSEITFYKSKKSDRWWMEIPCPQSVREKYLRHYLVPCSYSDYETAMEDEIPERWWRFFNKLSL